MNTFDSHVLMALIVVPFAGGIIVGLIPRVQRNAILGFSALVGLVSFLLSIYVFLQYDYGQGGYQMVKEFAWMDALGITFSLGVDGISVPMVLLTGIVLFTGVLISWNIKVRTKDFFVLYLLLVAGVFGVFVSLDLFFFFFFYELAVLPMYILIGVWGSSTDFGTFNRPKEYGAMKLMLMLVAGSVLVWVALLAVYVESGLGTFSLLALEDYTFSDSFQRLYFPLFMIGFGVLAGLMPFHTWSPDGHVAAPTAVSMVHAGVLMKLGAYGIIRVGIDLLPGGAEEWMPVLLMMATVNVVYGAMSAMGQQDLKYVIGYSSTSHMGYVLMGFATLNKIGMSGAVLQMFSHGIMTALFFASVGALYDRAHVRDITILEGLAKRMPLVAALFVIGGLTSLGLPGFSGFVAELMVFLGVFQDYPLVGVLAVIGAGITAVYILRLLAKVFFGTVTPRWEHLTDAGRVEAFAMVVLVLFLLIVGLYPRPWMDLINSGVAPILERVVGM